MRDLTDVGGDERAVSEVVGYALVFSLVLGALVFAYTGGLGGLTDTRDVEQVNNAERAFDVLANNFEKMGRGEAPHRAAEVKLHDSTLTTSDVHSASIRNESGDTVAHFNQHRPLRFEVNQDSQVVYEHGAVFRVDDGHGSMTRKPDFVIDENRTVIRYIESTDFGGGGQSVSGDTTVLLRASMTSSRHLYSNQSSEELTISINTTEDRADAWKSYLESELPEGGECDAPVENGDLVTITCRFETDSVHITRSRIRMEMT